MALMISLVALSIDAMLPALTVIGRDLGIATDNDKQLVITSLFLGLAFGQLLYGPLSDSIGRRRAIFLGYATFVAGSVMCIVASEFWVMLLGRALQGFGAAGPRVVCVALIRDRFEGRAMARVMSFIMAVFILVPVIAPSLGQGVLLIAHWRWIFVLILALALITLTWFAWRQPETLAANKRRPFRFGVIVSGAWQTLSHPVAAGYTLVTGLVFGAFVGLLISVEQIFAHQYQLGVRFPLYFAGLALSIGVASYLNAQLVMRMGMHRLCWIGLFVAAAAAAIFVFPTLSFAGHPPLWSLLPYLSVSLFLIGVLSGNLNALAMEPLGHIAGVGAAVVGSVSTLVAAGLGFVIGRFYDGNVIPIVLGFLLLNCLGMVAMYFTERAAARLAAGQSDLRSDDHRRG